MRAYKSASIYNSYTHQRARRSTIAGMLAVIYLLIALSPLASLAIHPDSMSHNRSGECSGDCNICGCSAESRASRTCCCAKKKQIQYGSGKLLALQSPVPQSATVPADAGHRSCTPSKPEKPAGKQKACCAEASQKPDEVLIDEPAPNAETGSPETVYKCGDPCGKGKTKVLAGTGTSETMPYIYPERIALPYEDTRFPRPPLHMSTRHTEPPDPPPQNAVIA